MNFLSLSVCIHGCQTKSAIRMPPSLADEKAKNTILSTSKVLYAREDFFFFFANRILIAISEAIPVRNEQDSHFQILREN